MEKRRKGTTPGFYRNGRIAALVLIYTFLIVCAIILITGIVAGCPPVGVTP